jgi:hypothetical protein
MIAKSNKIMPLDVSIFVDANVLLGWEHARIWESPGSSDGNLEAENLVR